MEYTHKLLAHLSEMLTDEESINHIDLAELSEEDNLTHFIHALTCASTMLFNKLTGSELNWLEFNHTANSLLFQYMDKPKEK